MNALVYCSEIQKKLSTTDFGVLINDAQRKNQLLNITGFLVKNEKNYVQYLEGPEGSIKRLMETISQDDRHLNIISKYLPFETTICQDWSMIETHDSLIGGVSFSHLICSVLSNWRKRTTSDQEADVSLGQLILKQIKFSKKHAPLIKI